MRNLIKRFVLLCLVLIPVLAQVATSQNRETVAANFGSPLAGVYATSSIVRAVDYGVSTTNTAAQNDTALLALNAKLLTSPSNVWRVVFDCTGGGTILYTNNRFLWGALNVIMEAYGCTFKNNSTSSWDQDKFPLWTGDIFTTTGNVPALGATWSYTTGYRFNTANSGATSITTTTAADAGNFTPGMRVLLSGYDQQLTQAGYPPNLRYTEEKVVLTADAGTGIITFANPIQNFYDSRWWDTTESINSVSLTFGAPRIIPLQRSDWTRPQMVWIRGGTWLVGNSATPAAVYVVVPADLTIFEDVTAPTVGATMSDTTLMYRVKTQGYVTEIDKDGGSLEIVDSLIDGTLSGNGGSLASGSGYNSITLRHTKIFNSIVGLLPRHLQIEDCDIIPLNGAPTNAVALSTGSRPITSVGVSNTRIFNTGTLTSGVDAGTVNNITFTVGAVSGTTIQLTWNATSQALADAIDYGITLQKSDGTNPGVVTGIYLTGGNTLNIEGTWTAPTPADTWKGNYVRAISDGGGNSIVGVQVPFWRSVASGQALSWPPDNTFLGNTTLGGTLGFTGGTFTLSSNANNGFLKWNNATNCFLGTGVFECDVQTNTHGQTNLNVSNNATTNIGTGTTTSLVTIGGGSNAVTLNATTLTENGAVNINNNNNAATNIGTGTTTSLVTVGGGSNAVTLNATTLTENGAVNINNNNNAATNIGTGTTTSLVTVGGGSNAVTIAASAGNLTLANVTTGTNADFVCMASGNKVTLQTSACT